MGNHSDVVHYKLAHTAAPPNRAAAATAPVRIGMAAAPLLDELVGLPAGTVDVGAAKIGRASCRERVLVTV